MDGVNLLIRVERRRDAQLRCPIGENMSIGVGPRKLNEVADRVWKMVLDIRLRPVEREPLLREPEDFVLASVTISGTWQAEVTLGCSGGLARMAAATMFGKQVDEVDPLEIRDALGELTNMLGGNVKTLLKGDARLSVPRVVSEIPACPVELVPFTRQWFECERGFVLVHMHWGATRA